MTNGFCDSYLDEEYKALCEKLIWKMSRKRVVPYMFKLRYFDSEFSTKEILDNSPFSNVFLNGMPIPIRSLPPELQEVARANPKKALTLWTIDKEQ
jgi:hypothetical protein